MTINSWINPPSNIDGYIGFVYVITEIDTGMKYIGIKSLWKINKKKPTKFLYDDDGKVIRYTTGKKKGLKKLNKRTSLIRTKVETDWKTYNTSSEIMQEKLDSNPDNYEKRISRLCTSITELKAWEAYMQLSYYASGEWNMLYNECINLRLRIRKD